MVVASVQAKGLLNKAFCWVKKGVQFKSGHSGNCCLGNKFQLLHLDFEYSSQQLRTSVQAGEVEIQGKHNQGGQLGLAMHLNISKESKPHPEIQPSELAVDKE